MTTEATMIPIRIRSGFGPEVTCRPKMRNTGKVFAFQREKGKRKNLANLPGSSAEKDDKLIKILPKDILNKTVRNPETGRDIKVQSALKYDDKAPVKRAATSLVAMMNKR